MHYDALPGWFPPCENGAMSEAPVNHSSMHAARRALRLSYFTVGYNIVEGVVSVAFAYQAGSPALLGFGVDSFVESASGGIMIWRFSSPEGRTSQEHLRRELRAVRLVAYALLVLAAYVAYESATKLYYGEAPERYLAGILIAAVSLVAMPVLFVLKRRTAETLASRSLAADAKQTLGCMMLSVALLVGSGIHYLAGWWQADPLAGLVIALFLVREGYKVLTEEQVCCPC